MVGGRLRGVSASGDRSAAQARRRDSAPVGPVAVSNLVCLALTGLLARRNRRWLPFLAAYAAATAASWPPRARGAAPARLSGAAALFNLLVAGPELALRLRGFEYPSGIQFGYPDPTQMASYAYDPLLFWRHAPGPGVNSLGFRGAEVVRPKPPGVVRALFLGDSVAELPHGAGYPGALEQLAVTDRSGATPRLESVVLAMAGYSSHQGLLLAREFGRQLEPDVVVVCFGWNDQWRAWGAPDAEKQPAAADLPGPALLSTLYRACRLLQLARWWLDRFRHRGAWQPRVPLDRFEANLLGIARHFRAQGAAVILVTSPSNHRRTGVPRYLVRKRFVPSACFALEQEGRYNEVVRQLAARESMPLLDLERELEPVAEPSAMLEWDGVHLTPAGHAEVARRLHSLLAVTGLYPPVRS